MAVVSEECTNKRIRGSRSMERVDHAVIGKYTYCGPLFMGQLTPTGPLSEKIALQWSPSAIN
ncbi:hypothetical protein LTR55_011779, partial [Exophiala xenobiotica]